MTQTDCEAGTPLQSDDTATTTMTDDDLIDPTTICTIGWFGWMRDEMVGDDQNYDII